MQIRIGVRTRMIAILAIAAAIFSVLVSGCSAPGVFPSIFADPAQRSDTTLSPAEVKEETVDLISERERLCARALASEGAEAAATARNCASPGAAATGAPSADGEAAKP